MEQGSFPGQRANRITEGDFPTMQDLLRGLDKHIPIGLVVLDRNQTVRYINAYMATQTAMVLEEVVGKNFTSVFSLAQPERVACAYGLCDLCTGKTPRLDDELAPVEINVQTGPQCSKRLHSLMCFPFTDDAGNDYHALLFYEPDADETGGFHRGFSGAIEEIREARNGQRRLLKEIERANDNLIRSEKLAGIGQLAAGVAHEINNPVGYVFSNLRTLAGYVTDLLKIIDAVDQAQSVDEVRRLMLNLDYSYIRGDVEALIQESGEGIDRVKRIISALQDFCHNDSDVFSLADVHRGLDTTLSVAANKIKYKAVVIKEYGELPKVQCNASQINQVILNLLVNAAHAIEHDGIITVRTGKDGGDIWFEVQDNGKGMEPAVISRLFEPFFTTKPVGEGTGLGLALSYNIVQKHHGRIEVFSQIGEGARIRVWLPIAQPHLTEVKG